MIDERGPQSRRPRNGPRFTWARGFLVAYLVLLALSHWVRWRTERARPPEPFGPTRIEVPVQSERGGEWVAGPERTPFAWHAWEPEAGRSVNAAAPTILLLHGSPGEASNFASLGPLLARGRDGRTYRVLAPDLPGFGGSRGSVPDVSVAAHARYVWAWLDGLGIDRLHVVGFSMGGGVGIEMAALDEDRMLSLTLLSAIGVQELELLGEYNINHALHGVQLAGLWLLQEAVPHFGAFDDTMLDVAYARNFFDTDQRPLRGVLQGLEIPMLVIHGREDPLVPYAAAIEHHRLVPQSELVTFDGSHFMVFNEAPKLSSAVLDFVRRVDDGVATRRSDADPERRIAAAAPRGPLPPMRGLALIVGMMLIAVATGVSEDLTCIAAGLLVVQGRLGFAAASIACFVGVLIGDFALYAAGRWLGRPWLERAPLRWLIDADDIARSARWFERRGGWVIFISRFIPGARLPTYTTAGLLRLPAGWFTIRLLIPIAISTPLLVGASVLIGRRLMGVFDTFSRYALPTLMLTLLMIWSMLFAVRVISSHRRRRLLHGRILRLLRWEYWPWWALYPPVIVLVLWLGSKHRSLTLFTAANPGIWGGGFAGESKSEILARLGSEFVAPFVTVPASGDLESRRARVDRWLDEQDLTLPIVLKPDSGERGAGVAIVRDPASIDRYLENTTVDVIAQAFVPGPELGVFYVRLPGESRGRIFSITEKRLPRVRGDGRRNLEQLILDDPRAVAHARAYRKRFAARLDEVPGPGEEVRLGELGVHSRGALFVDGAALGTPALEAAVERISRSFEGFHVGRYDLKAPSLEAFREGRDIRVLELNGVTAEATHMYDPKHSLLDAYRILFAQWRLTFEAGRRNRERGVRPLGVAALLRMTVRHLRGQSTREAGAKSV